MTTPANYNRNTNGHYWSIRPSPKTNKHNNKCKCSHFNEIFDGLDEHVFAEPEADKTAEKVTHAEQADSCSAGDEYYHQSEPV